MYGMNVLVYTVTNQKQPSNPAMTPPHKRRRVEDTTSHGRVVGHLAQVVRNHSQDPTIREILQIFTSEFTTMDIPESVVSEVRRYLENPCFSR